MDAFATLLGVILGLALIGGVQYLRIRAKQRAFRSREEANIENEGVLLPPLPVQLANDLADGFQSINWRDSEHIPPLDRGEITIFHTMLKDLLVRGLVLYSNRRRSKLDPESRAFFTGTDRRLIVSAMQGRRQEALFSTPYANISRYSGTAAQRTHTIIFKTGDSLEIELGVPEGLLHKHTSQLDKAFKAIIAHDWNVSDVAETSVD